MPASEFRKVQMEHASQKKDDREKRDREFTERFKAACDKYTELLLEEASIALKHAQGRFNNYIILDNKDRSPILQDCEGFAYTSFIYGRWDKRNHRFDDSVFARHSIARPLETAQKVLEEAGYKLENISDPKRSRRLFLKLSWPSAVEKRQESDE
jgi:hypothetical protein